MTKTKGLRHFYISDPVFKTKTLFVIGGKESDFKALMESKFNVDYQARVEDEFNVGTVLSLMLNRTGSCGQAICRLLLLLSANWRMRSPTLFLISAKIEAYPHPPTC